MDADNPVGWEQEWSFRVGAMEAAVAQLDREGLFGNGAARAQIVLNVEVMPPDAGNVERARRLNPAEAIITWLEEVGSEHE
jgi:hypothetical protein